MAEDKIYAGTIGLEVLINMKENIVGAANITLNVKQPDGTTTEWEDATVYEEEFLRYVTKDGELEDIGSYKIHPDLTLSGWSGPCNTVSIRTYGPYK